MSKPSYAEQISNAQVMVSGLKGNADKVVRRGIDGVFVTGLDANLQTVTTLNNEQEKLKADLKAKTAELDAKLLEVEAAVAEAKKIVKMDFPKEQWKEFGIADKR
ncbi:MAG: hypothetical protein WCJ03_11005 [Bacteroidales bacterium]